MNNGYSFKTRFLQQAGLISASLGMISFLALLLALREQNPVPKLQLGIFAVLGILLARTLGRDVLTIVKNAEAGTEMISLTQQRLAFVGTRFTSVLTGLIVLILLASVVFFFTPFIERIAMVCSGPSSEAFMRCAHNAFGFPFQ